MNAMLKVIVVVAMVVGSLALAWVVPIIVRGADSEPIARRVDASLLIEKLKTEIIEDKAWEVDLEVSPSQAVKHEGFIIEFKRNNLDIVNALRLCMFGRNLIASVPRNRAINPLDGNLDDESRSALINWLRSRAALQERVQKCIGQGITALLEAGDADWRPTPELEDRIRRSGLPHDFPGGVRMGPLGMQVYTYAAMPEISPLLELAEYVGEDTLARLTEFAVNRKWMNSQTASTLRNKRFSDASSRSK